MRRLSDATVGQRVCALRSERVGPELVGRTGVVTQVGTLVVSVRLDRLAQEERWPEVHFYPHQLTEATP